MRNEEGKSNDKTIPRALYNGGHADTLTSIIDQIRRDHSRRTKQQPSLTTKRILNREEDINAFFVTISENSKRGRQGQKS